MGKDEHRRRLENTLRSREIVGKNPRYLLFFILFFAVGSRKVSEMICGMRSCLFVDVALQGAVIHI